MKLATWLVLLAISCTAPASQDNAQSIGEAPDEDDMFAAGFKEFLKSEGESLDIHRPNAFESLQPGNLYSNHVLNVSVDFPDEWMCDRGIGEFTVFRAFERDSGLTMSLLVVPLEEGLTKSIPPTVEFDDSPVAHMNALAGGDYQSHLVSRIKQQTGTDPLELQLSEHRIGLSNFLVVDYKFKVTSSEHEYYMRARSWQLLKWRRTYQIAYSAPEGFFSPGAGELAVYRARFSDPNIP